MRKRLVEHGLIDPRTGKIRQFKREDEPLRLMAQYDRPIDFGPALDRVMAANQAPLIEGLKQVFLRSGINPQYIAPAVHDQGGLTRASVIAIGQASNQNTRQTGTAWVGLLGRQPGMLSFKGNPQGKDSIYVFHHHNADVVRNVLQSAGIVNRTIVPEANHYKVYVYDPGNKYRAGMAQALSDLRAQATEWRGDGKPIGGNTEDMGRAQYRGVINRAEAQHFARPVSDQVAIFRNLIRKPQDDAHWGVLADRMDELGRPHFAALLRHLAGRPLTHYPRSRRYKVTNPVREYIHPELDQIAYAPHPWNVFGVEGKVEGIPITPSLQHGIPTGNTWLHRLPTMAGVISGRPDELKEFPAFGHVAVTTSHGRPVGEARLPIPEFQQVVGEGGPSGKRMMRFRQKLYEHLQTSAARRMAGESVSPRPVPPEHVG